MKTYFKINSENEIKAIAAKILEQIEGCKLILLRGDLGAGKTALSKEFVRFLTGEEKVTSPTFTIVNTYEGMGNKVAHYDLYRLKSEEEIEELPLEEDISNGYVLIEWPEIASRVLSGRKCAEIDITIEGDESRMVSVSYGGPRV